MCHSFNLNLMCGPVLCELLVSFSDGVPCGVAVVLANAHVCTFPLLLRCSSTPSAYVCTIPSWYRSTSANSQPASASLPPSMPTRAAIGSPEQLAPPTSPPQKDTQPKTPPTSPPQKDTQPKTPPTSAPQESAMLQTSVAASPQHGTPSKGVAGKVRCKPHTALPTATI